jgi:hypothetical protein
MMNSLLKMICFLFLLVSSEAWAQLRNYEFRIQGTFNLQATSPNPRPVNFSLAWLENNENKILGTYHDDFYDQSAPVTGTASEQGRLFDVNFPKVKQGVKSIKIVSSDISMDEGGIPLNLTLEGPQGQKLLSTNIVGTMVNTAPEGAVRETTESTGCSIGFGALTGFCGLYQGEFLELEDTSNRCQLNTTGTLVFELSETKNISLYLNYINSVVGLPMHQISEISSPPERSLYISGRSCGLLPGTTFFQDSCRRLDLAGVFTQKGDDRGFQGNYTITDEKTNQSCTYSLNLTRELTY